MHLLPCNKRGQFISLYTHSYLYVISCRNVNRTSLIRRICTLLSSDVPPSVKLVLHTTCLNLLYNYILGPDMQLQVMNIRNASVWSPEELLTKRVVECEHLPQRLLQLLTDNGKITSNNQDLLRSIVRCIGAYAERDSHCLEVCLRLGFRQKIVELLRQSGVGVSFLRSALGTLAILCGHTHSFDEGEDVPKAIELTQKELFDILYTQQYILESVMTQMQTVDERVIINSCFVLKYMLPLLSTNDKLYHVSLFFYNIVVNE